MSADAYREVDAVAIWRHWEYCVNDGDPYGLDCTDPRHVDIRDCDTFYRKVPVGVPKEDA